MKNAPPPNTEAVRSTLVDVHSESETPLPAFTISDFTRVDYGSKVAQFKICFPHLEMEAGLYCPIGKPPFATPASIRDRYLGAYRRTARFSDELREAILGEALRLYDGGSA